MKTKYFGEFRDMYSKAAGDVYSKAVSEMYSKTVSEMYSQFKQKEIHPMEEYIGRHVVYMGREVIGYASQPGAPYSLIIEAPQGKGWTKLGSYDVVIKKCESYLYASINDLID